MSAKSLGLRFHASFATLTDSSEWFRIDMLRQNNAGCNIHHRSKRLEVLQHAWYLK
jgi:hypothetical protein